VIIRDKDLADLAYLGLISHLKEKLESHIFSDVSQVLQRALDCESQAKESRNFPRTSNNLSQASTSAARSSSGKRSRTLLRQNSEGRDHRQ
jgi:hypothetical protein